MRYAYVGCRTTKERGARGLGIAVFSVDDVTGRWQYAGTVPDLVNPSYLSFDKEKKFLYTVHGDFAEASAFSIHGETGIPSLLNTVECGGKNPVYIIPERTNHFMIVASLGGGSVAAIVRNSDGSLGALAHRQLLPGKDEGFPSYPHQICYDRNERFLLVPTQGRKGGQSGVMVYDFDAQKGFIEKSFYKSREHDECRHIAVHPNNIFAYVVNEHNNTVTSLLYGPGGTLEPFQVSQTLPDTYPGSSQAAEVVISEDGQYLFVSIRTYDSVVIYRVDQQSGLLKTLGWVPSQGEIPRFITLDPTGRFLHVANENSDSIVSFRVEENGGLVYTGQTIPPGPPVCIVFS